MPTAETSASVKRADVIVLISALGVRSIVFTGNLSQVRYSHLSSKLNENFTVTSRLEIVSHVSYKLNEKFRSNSK